MVRRYDSGEHPLAILRLAVGCEVPGCRRATGRYRQYGFVCGQRGSTAVEYGASKAAVINLTKSLGMRLGQHGIRVNAIAPG